MYLTTKALRKSLCTYIITSMFNNYTDTYNNNNNNNNNTTRNIGGVELSMNAPVHDSQLW